MNNIKKYPVLLWVIFLLITPIALVPWVHGNDGAGYYSYVRSAFIDRDFDLGNEKEFFEQSFNVNSIKEDPNTGIFFSQYPIGTPLLWAPFFLTGHIIASFTSFAMDGYSLPYVYMVSLASAIMGFLALLMIYSFCHKFFSKKISLLSTISFWAASSVFYYMYLEPSLSHAASLFSVTAFIFYWHKTIEKRTHMGWFFLGLLASLMIMVRYQNVLFLIILLIYALRNYYVLWKKGSSVLQLFSKHVIFLISIIFGLIPQFLMLQYQHGYGLSALDYYQTSINLVQGSTFWIKVLFSSNHGLFTWTPIILLSVIGLFYGLKKYAHSENYFLLILSFLIAFLLQLIFVASLSAWHGAQSFGHRMFLNTSLIFVFGLCILLSNLEKRFGSWSIWLIVISLPLWNFGLMIQYGLRAIPTEGAVNFLDVLHNNIFIIPKHLVSIIKAFFSTKTQLSP